MANTQGAAAQQSQQPGKDYLDIEEMAAKTKTPEPIHRGTCASQNWRSGKQVTEAEYRAAVKAFSSSPMGRPPKSNGKEAAK